MSFFINIEYTYTGLGNQTVWPLDVFKRCAKCKVNKVAASLTLWCLAAHCKNTSVRDTVKCGGICHTCAHSTWETKDDNLLS